VVLKLLKPLHGSVDLFNRPLWPHGAICVAAHAFCHLANHVNGAKDFYREHYKVALEMLL
jgi:hypothetical protein